MTVSYSRGNSDAALLGELSVPADKSITHRSILFSSFAEGESKVTTSTIGRDNLASIRVMQRLGVDISGSFPEDVFAMVEEEDIQGFSLSEDGLCHIVVQGRGFVGFNAPSEELYCGNSGTTARLLTGILAGSNFSATLNGDESLIKRPFKRVTEPLCEMGAKFSSEMLPLTIEGGKISGMSYVSPRASAQVKSAILLAGLQSSDSVTVIEPQRSRDHTERMLTAMGCGVEEKKLENGAWSVTLKASSIPRKLNPFSITVPADFSSAAFFMTLAAVIPGSKICIRDVGVSATRIGLYHLLCRMGAKIELKNQREDGGESVADIYIEASRLKGIEVAAKDVVLAIDEIPILAIAAAVAEGETVISGASELRVKESDRISMTAAILNSFSAGVEQKEDGLLITGNPALIASNKGAAGELSWKDTKDHRILMAGSVMEYIVSGSFEIHDIKEVETSFPGFVQCFQMLDAN